jgi:hypothetical protein
MTSQSVLMFGWEFLRFTLAFACIFIMPGMLLFNLFFRRREHDIFEVIPVAMVFSIALLSIAGVLLYLVGLNANSMLLMLPPLLLMLIALNAARWGRKRHAHSMTGEASADVRVEEPKKGRSLTLAIYGLLILAAALMAYRGAVFVWSADTYDHAGTVREIVEKREILPGDTFYGGEERLGPDPRKGLFHACLAILSIMTKIEPFQIFLWLPILLLPILLCSYLAFAGSLFKNRTIAFLSTALFLICYGGLDRSNLRMVGLPGMVAIQFYFIALCFMFKYLENRRLRFLLASAIIGCVTAIVHIYYFFHFILALTSFLVFSMLLRRQDKGALTALGKLVLTSLVLAVPLLALRYKLSYSVANPYDVQPRHVLFIAKNVFITNPLEAWNILGPMGILAFGATPFLLKRAKADAGMLFLFAAMITTPLIIFNPLAVNLFGRVMTFGLVRRIALFAPYIAVIGFFVHRALSSLRGRVSKRGNLRALAFLVLFVVLLIPYIRGFLYEYNRASIEDEEKHSYVLWRDALSFMRDNVTEPSVILSDPLTSFSIPALTQHNIVAVLIGHASPQDAQNINRVSAADDVLNPYVDMERTIAVLNRYHVQYIVVNQTFSASLYGSYWSVDVKHYEAARRKFESHPALFEKVYQKNKVYIYRYHPGAESPEMATEKPLSLPFVLEREPPMEKVDAVFGGRFVLMGVAMDEKIVRRHESLSIRCYWKCTEADTTIQDYKVFVRFDTQYKKNMLYRRQFSKIYRLILQKITGTRYRFRSEHSPVGGSYPPRLWQKGAIIEDEFDVIIPSDVSKGAYDVKINLLSLPFSPNYFVKDLLSDHDVYEGIKVGSVTIE